MSEKPIPIPEFKSGIAFDEAEQLSYEELLNSGLVALAGKVVSGLNNKLQRPNYRGYMPTLLISLKPGQQAKYHMQALLDLMESTT